MVWTDHPVTSNDLNDALSVCYETSSLHSDSYNNNKKYGCFSTYDGAQLYDRVKALHIN